MRHLQILWLRKRLEKRMRMKALKLFYALLWLLPCSMMTKCLEVTFLILLRSCRPNTLLLYSFRAIQKWAYYDRNKRSQLGGLLLLITPFINRFYFVLITPTFFLLPTTSFNRFMLIIIIKNPFLPIFYSFMLDTFFI
jgi:hypothetical protein